MELDEITPSNIVSFRQNNPELVIMDCIREFNFSDKQCDIMRKILMARGVNKWLFARRKFIKLKHEVKDRLKNTILKSQEYYIYSWLNVKMQDIAKTPRWVEFPRTTTHNFKNIEKDIIVKGKRM